MAAIVAIKGGVDWVKKLKAYLILSAIILYYLLGITAMLFNYGGGDMWSIYGALLLVPILVPVTAVTFACLRDESEEEATLFFCIVTVVLLALTITASAYAVTYNFPPGHAGILISSKSVELIPSSDRWFDLKWPNMKFRSAPTESREFLEIPLNDAEKTAYLHVSWGIIPGKETHYLTQHAERMDRDQLLVELKEIFTPVLLEFTSREGAEDRLFKAAVKTLEPYGLQPIQIGIASVL